MKKIHHLLIAAALLIPAVTKADYDFGDHKSVTILGKAWAAQDEKNDNAVIAYTSKCIELYKPAALEQQSALTAPPTDKDEVFKQWALNDVGTCLFLRGQAYERQGKTEEAIESYKVLVESMPFAQCWDTKGWSWKPADAAAGRLKSLEFDAK